jgi:hypothetical protein
LGVLEKGQRGVEKGKSVMSKTKNRDNSSEKTSRLQVGKLQPKDRELKNHEADRIKGGGAAMGGVDPWDGTIRRAERNTIGEEIPSL